MSPLDRRTLLKGASAAASELALAGAAAARSPRVMAQDAEPDAAMLDVAIVGGGVAGAYCAWRLAGVGHGAGTPTPGQASPPLCVTLFEASERIGGRLWSFVPPGMPHLIAELGGMRVPTNQTLVMALIDRLGIETVSVSGGDAHNLRYLRGRRYTVADAGNPEVIPYRLPKRYRGKSSGQIALETIEQYIPNASRLGLEAWNEARRTAAVDGVPLSEVGFHYLMERDLPPAVYEYVREATGYDVFRRNANAADIMYELAGGASLAAPVVAPRLGMEEIPRALAAEARRGGAEIRTGQRVRRITSTTGDGETGSALRLEVEDVATGNVNAFTARHVIIAMPPRAIALLAPDSLPLTAPSFPALQAALVPVAVGKAYLGYERPWWRDLGITVGHSITDLPLKVTTYLGMEGEQPGAQPADQSSLIGPTYAEDTVLDYWATFRRQDPTTAGGAPYQRPEIGAVPDELALPERAVREMERQLRLVHGRSVRIGDATMAVMSDWRRDPFGAAYHFWAVGTTAWDMVPVARTPVPGVNLSICGEAWSSGQGWTMGALMTAERTLQERLGLTWPDWLPAGVDLGP
jgi:monoamine oxidase